MAKSNVQGARAADPGLEDLCKGYALPCHGDAHPDRLPRGMRAAVGANRSPGHLHVVDDGLLMERQ